jgi:hypothetical protein
MNRRKEERKIRPLSFSEHERVVRRLHALNTQAALIAELLWFLNDNFGGVHFVTLEQLLLIRIHDIELETEAGPAQLNLSRRGFRGVEYIGHYLTTELYHAIIAQVRKNSIFVFSNRYGASISPVQIDKFFRKAGQVVGLKDPVTSLSFRPSGDTHADLRARGIFDEVSNEEWEDLLQHIPEIHPIRGAKPVHDSLDLLNAILHSIKTHCPIRKLPKYFPPFEAVKSQRRRWVSKGVLNKIFKHRAQKA